LNKAIKLFCAIILFDLVMTVSVWACGPNFDDAYLIRGTSDQFFSLPEGNFHDELKRISKEEPEIQHAREGTAFEHTVDSDINDLEIALHDLMMPLDPKEKIISAYRAIRKRIQQFINDNPVESNLNWYGGRFRSFERHPFLNTSAIDQPFEFPPKLPQEFILYTQGALAYYKNDFNAAITKWKTLLSLPGKERSYKSVWAAFMIGKAYLSLRKYPEAISYFEMTRQLRNVTSCIFSANYAGGPPQLGPCFYDSLNLNEESYGWQALAELESGNYVSSIHHYLPQLDENSLSWICHRILELDETHLEKIFQDKISRNVLLAWMVSRSDFDSAIFEQDHHLIEVLEKLEMKDPLDNADHMAWMFYNFGQMEDAKRWLKLSKEKTPLAQWISAKILLRDGKLDAGLKKLAQVARYFEQHPYAYPGRYETNVYEQHPYAYPGWYEINASRQQVYSEIGVLRLKRQDYVMALDAFSKGRYWEDAAYVAERVLTSEELEEYLKGQTIQDNEIERSHVLKNMRHLLARRLAREGEWEKAIVYMPVELKGKWSDQQANEPDGREKRIYKINPQEKLKMFHQFLLQAKEESFPKNHRARAYYEAGLIMRQFGMELFGTELDPDWLTYNGWFDPGDNALTLRFGIVEQMRVKERNEDVQEEFKQAKTIVEKNKKQGGFLVGGEDEKKRVLTALPSPNRRFHYRYKAADLMWQAAQLLPNNNELKAVALYKGGIYLKDRDVTAADRFYKELVRTCGKTELGKAADKLRWFPIF